MDRIQIDDDVVIDDDDDDDDADIDVCVTIAHLDDRQSPDIHRHRIALFGHVDVAVRCRQTQRARANASAAADAASAVRRIAAITWQSARRRFRPEAASAARRRRLAVHRLRAAVRRRRRHRGARRSVRIAHNATRLRGPIRTAHRRRHDALPEDLRSLEDALEDATGSATATAVARQRRRSGRLRRWPLPSSSTSISPTRRLRIRIRCRRSVQHIENPLLIRTHRRRGRSAGLRWRGRPTNAIALHRLRQFAVLQARQQRLQIGRDALQQRVQLIGVDFTVQIRIEAGRWRRCGVRNDSRTVWRACCSGGGGGRVVGRAGGEEILEAGLQVVVASVVVEDGGICEGRDGRSVELGRRVYIYLIFALIFKNRNQTKRIKNTNRVSLSLCVLLKMPSNVHDTGKLYYS